MISGVVDQHVNEPKFLLGRVDDRLPPTKRRHILLDKARIVAHFLRQRGTGLLVHIRQHNLGALCDKQPRVSLTHALGCAGDDCYLAV